MDTIKEALTFDDVLLLPKYSNVLPSKTNIFLHAKFHDITSIIIVTLEFVFFIKIIILNFLTLLALQNILQSIRQISTHFLLDLAVVMKLLNQKLVVMKSHVNLTIYQNQLAFQIFY